MRDCWEIGIRYPAGIKVLTSRKKKSNFVQLNGQKQHISVSLCILPLCGAVPALRVRPWLVLSPPRCLSMRSCPLCPGRSPSFVLVSDWLQQHRGCLQTPGQGGGREARAGLKVECCAGPFAGPAGSHTALETCPKGGKQRGGGIIWIRAAKIITIRSISQYGLPLISKIAWSRMCKKCVKYCGLIIVFYNHQKNIFIWLWSP